MEIYRSARNHGVEDADLEHAVVHSLASAYIGEAGASPWRLLYLGPDRAGNLLEVVVLERDDGSELAIHAMKMRSNYEEFLLKKEWWS